MAKKNANEFYTPRPSLSTASLKIPPVSVQLQQKRWKNVCRVHISTGLAPRRLSADEDQPWSAETYQRRELTPSVAILQNVSSVIFTGSH